MPKSYFLCIFLFCFSCFSRADDQAVSVGYLNGFDDIQGLRVAWRPTTLDIDTTWLGDVNVYLEGSVNFWRYSQNGDRETDSNFTVALTPVIIKRLGAINDRYPVYLEAGIGLSVESDQHFAGKDIGSHYQFEDKLGLIVDLDESEKLTQQIAVRLIHYSNGGLNNDNPGLDFLNLAYIAHF